MMIKSIHYTFITLIRACVCEFPLQQLLIGRLRLLFEECNCTCSLSRRDEGSEGLLRRRVEEEEGFTEQDEEEEEEAGVDSAQVQLLMSAGH